MFLFTCPLRPLAYPLTDCFLTKKCSLCVYTMHCIFLQLFLRSQNHLPSFHSQTFSVSLKISIHKSYFFPPSHIHPYLTQVIPLQTGCTPHDNRALPLTHSNIINSTLLLLLLSVFPLVPPSLTPYIPHHYTTLFALLSPSKYTSEYSNSNFLRNFYTFP